MYTFNLDVSFSYLLYIFLWSKKWAYKIVNALFVLFLETPTIQIYPDEPDGKYYVGEDVTIKANIRNPLGVLCVTWQKETEAGTHTINTALPKYKETSHASDEHQLLIRDCNDSDQGGYFLLAACNYDQEDARSNKIYLNIVKGNSSNCYFKKICITTYDYSLLFLYIRNIL